MKILSIDAWGSEEGWEWNSWHNVGEISKEEFEALDTDEKILEWAGNELILDAKDLCEVEDDQYNKIIVLKKDMRPLYAIEYGPEYQL